MTSSRTMTRTLALASAFVLVVAACGSGTASQAPAATAGASADPGASQGASPEANACGTEPLTLNVWGGYPEVDEVYKQAGAVHGCALATNEPSSSQILMFVEDVGRHNAVDAIAGRMWLDRLDGGDKIFYTTGRLTSEMVIKAAQMQIPVLVSRSGLTKMGHEVATQVGITMIGRAVNKHYLLFTGEHRLVRTPMPKVAAR